MLELHLIREKQFLLVFLVGICVTRTPSFSLEINTNRCLEKEGEALRSIHPTCSNHYSHNYHNCCNWPGVYCSNVTGRVKQLWLGEFLVNCEDNLQSETIHLGPSLTALEELIYLEITDLGLFSVDTNMSFIGSFPQLRYLVIESSGDGYIPLQIGNLTMLQYLKISFFPYEVVPDLSYISRCAGSLKMLSHLTSLRRLILQYIDLHEATDWLHVVNNLPSLEHLDLSYCDLPDAIPHPHSITNSSKSISFIDLSSNYLLYSSLWSWIFNCSSLARLYLSDNKLNGIIPSRLTELTSLSHLDLSYNQLEGGLSSSIKGLCKLQRLDLSGNIVLKGDLSNIFQSLSCSNNSLMFLSLQENNLSGSVPEFTKFSSLKYLNLFSNKLNGSLPSTFKRPSNLVTLNLQENQLTGSVPDLSVFRSLRVLQLQDNQLNGTIHAGLGQLSRLEQLDISSNSLKGEIGVGHLSNLSRLRHLDMSFNSLSFNVGSSWVPPFRLDTIALASCRLGSRFPEWLQTQTNYVSLDISYAGISDTIPLWFWNLSSIASFIGLSHNRLCGELYNSSTKRYPVSSVSAIDLSSNLLEGTIPSFFGGVFYLNLSRNSFSGSISCETPLPMLGLDLSHNFLTGQLPDCWLEGGDSLSVLDLSNNIFSGKLPSSLGSLIRLESLHLRNNKFSGKVPSSLRYLTNLTYLDLGDNLFSGEIPKWIGHMLSNLTVLSLRNNSFSGNIPLDLCLLSSVQILDLSLNNISGVIPNCLCSFTAMTQKMSRPVVIIDSNDTFSTVGSPYKDYISIVLKGFKYEYQNHLELVKSIDLSSNNLGGDIPGEISCLTGLISLNFSGNNLIGSITPKIGQLKSLESLDLSNNHLYGEIPSTLSNLNFLGTLSLANNNLSGRIPAGTQIQSFNASVFAGNPRLCGDPLPKKCIADEGGKADGIPKSDGEDISLGLYISIALGFISGFWGVCGVLIFKRSWRHAYFRFWVHWYDRLYVIISLKLASIRRRI